MPQNIVIASCYAAEEKTVIGMAECRVIRTHTVFYLLGEGKAASFRVPLKGLTRIAIIIRTLVADSQLRSSSSTIHCKYGAMLECRTEFAGEIT